MDIMRIGTFTVGIGLPAALAVCSGIQAFLHEYGFFDLQ